MLQGIWWGGGALNSKGERNSRSCHHSQSPPDVSVNSRETCFPCTASTFKPRIHSHHGGTWDSPVGKPRGKASWESLEGTTWSSSHLYCLEPLLLRCDGNAGNSFRTRRERILDSRTVTRMIFFLLITLIFLYLPLYSDTFFFVNLRVNFGLWPWIRILYMDNLIHCIQS